MKNDTVRSCSISGLVEYACHHAFECFFFKGCVAVESLAVSLCQLKFLTLSRWFWELRLRVCVLLQVRLDL
jgi:hypothetical protein